MDVLRRCPLANLDRRMINEQVIGAHTRPGQGLFVTALQRRLAKRGVAVRFDEYDFALEIQAVAATSFSQAIAVGTPAVPAARQR